jgi:hypothetical protein
MQVKCASADHNRARSTKDLTRFRLNISTKFQTESSRAGNGQPAFSIQGNFRREHLLFLGINVSARAIAGNNPRSDQMSIVRMVTGGKSGEEVFTLDEGRVSISYPAKLSSESLEDLRQYLDIFYRKACRLTDDPIDAVDANRFDQRPKVLSRAAE